MKKTVLRKYANLIAAKGVNVQKGQEIFIQAELDQPEFVKMLVEECYKLGAKTVVVDWSYQPLQKWLKDCKKRTLSDEDMAAISGLNQNLRSNVQNDPENFPW